MNSMMVAAARSPRARRWIFRALAAVMLVPLLAGPAVISLAGLQGAGRAGAAPLPSCGGVLAPVAVDGGFDAEQVGNAATIIRVGQQLGVPERGWLIAVAVALQESSLVNVAHGDTAGPDSRGLFQQRDSWGPLEVRMDPAGASDLFYRALLRVDGWEQMPLTVAAQTVQRSAFPSAYAKQEAPAAGLVSRLAGTAVSGPCGASESKPVAGPGGMVLPLPAQWVHPPMAEHHDYPATDIGVPAGTPVFSMVAGVTRAVDQPGGCGTGIAVIDGDGNEWMFCHGTARTVASGVRVAAGDQVLVSGWSGSVIPPGPAGAHLHVQIRRGGPGGPTVCPQPILNALATGQPAPDVGSLRSARPCV